MEEAAPLLRPFAPRPRRRKSSSNTVEPRTQFSRKFTAVGIAMGAVACTVGTVAVGRTYFGADTPVIESSEAELGEEATSPFNSKKERLDTAPPGGPLDGSATPNIIHLSNAYTRASGRDIGEGYYSWTYLAERHADTLIEVLDSTDDCEYDWSLTTDGQTYTASGTSATFAFLATGWHQLLLTSTCSGVANDFTYDVMSKPVRRELRSMSDDDREAFFTALETVYKTSQADGEKMYGPKYRSITRMVSEHLLGAADKTCDHWHDDAGVMTHHVAFTLEMEQSLMSIDSSVTVPYWDYTQDAYYLSDWTTSEIFDDDWFGTASPMTEGHMIKNGRWAYLEVGKQADSEGIRNPYGLLRSPWNTNPVPYVLRHRYVLDEKDGGWVEPGCVDFAEAFEYTSLGNYFNELNGELHGPVHIMIGGQWWVPETYNFSATNGGDFLLASKWLWRQGYIRCPETCSEDTPASDCVCTCPDELTSHFATSKEFMNGTGLFALSDGLFTSWVNFVTTGCRTEDDCYDIVKDTLCHVGHAGEMFTSSAPYDPIFWPIHGLADRYLQLKRLMAHNNDTTLDMTWDYYHDGMSPSDTHHVCDWSQVKEGSMEMPVCSPGDCAGHRKDDLLPMSNFLDTGDTYTNEQFLDFVSPFNDEIPYVYDSFTDWPACTDQGITFWEADYVYSGPDATKYPKDSPLSMKQIKAAKLAARSNAGRTFSSGM